MMMMMCSHSLQSGHQGEHLPTFFVSAFPLIQTWILICNAINRLDSVAVWLCCVVMMMCKYELFIKEIDFDGRRLFLCMNK